MRVLRPFLVLVALAVVGNPTPAGAAGYTVQRGDTLSVIAKRTGVTVHALVKANRLRDANHIRVGQVLELPGGGPAARSLCPVSGKPRTAVHNWGDARPGGRRHTGNDIFARRGTPVVANVGGRVRFVTGAVAGNAYYLAGDDGVTYYGAHLDRITARPGRLERGGQIGTVGTSGNAAGLSPHLHFEAKPGGGSPVDPWSGLRANC